MYEHDGGHELMWIEGSGSRRSAARGSLSQMAEPWVNIYQ